MEKNNLETTTEEKISFTYHKLSYNIVQKTVTKRINNKLEARVISGPLNGTLFEILCEEIESGTKVTVNVDLKLGLKYKFLAPIIKRKMKMAIIAVFYKMHTTIIVAN